MAGIRVQSFGDTIRQAREARKWTVTELAKQTGTRKGYISGIETGRAKPPKDWLVIALANVLKLNRDELLMRAYVERAPTIIRDKLLRRCYGTL